MRKTKFLAAFLLMCSAPSVFAANLTINLTNQSADTINELALTSKDALELSESPDEGNMQSSEPPVQNNPELSQSPATNILAAPLAAGDSGAVTVDAAEGECIFKLTFTFASGKVFERADTDICQADGIVIE